MVYYGYLLGDDYYNLTADGKTKQVFFFDPDGDGERVLAVCCLV